MTAAALAGAFLPAAASAAGAADLFYERAVMTAAGRRCALFGPDISAALAASRAQARGAALRAGAAPAQLSQIEARAQQKAGAVACASADMRIAAGRVRTAFDGYARLYRMSYPGDTASWRAERVLPEKVEGWRLSQAARFGFDQAVFGLAARRGEPSQLSVSLLPADSARPYAARLIVRDVAKAPQAYLLSGSGPRTPLPSRMVPRSGARTFMAQSRATMPDLSPTPGRPAVLFRFPMTAADVLEGLDPREAIAIEFLYAGERRDTVRTAYFEVGDFAAGRAFSQMAQR